MIRIKEILEVVPKCWKVNWQFHQRSTKLTIIRMILKDMYLKNPESIFFSKKKKNKNKIIPYNDTIWRWILFISTISVWQKCANEADQPWQTNRYKDWRIDSKRSSSLTFLRRLTWRIRLKSVVNLFCHENEKNRIERQNRNARQ